MKTHLVFKGLDSTPTLKNRIMEAAEMSAEELDRSDDSELTVVVDMPRVRNHTNGRAFSIHLFLRKMGNKGAFAVTKTSRDFFSALSQATHTLKKLIRKRNQHRMQLLRKVE